MEVVTIKGIIFSGEGVGKNFVSIPWAKKQIKEKLGFVAYLGTLNIRLSKNEAEKTEKILKEFKGIEITPENGYFSARCFKILVMNKMKGAIIIPQKPNYPSNVLELIAPNNLRKTLCLKDGDSIAVNVLLNTNFKS